MSENGWVYLDVQVIRRETEKAFQVILEDGTFQWLPKSQVSRPDDYQAGDRNCTIGITQWLAQEKGLDDGQ